MIPIMASGFIRGVDLASVDASISSDGAVIEHSRSGVVYL